MVLEHEAGLDPRYSTKGAYGTGVYLAERAIYSNDDQYVHRFKGPSGLRQLLLCRAALGVWFDFGEETDVKRKIPPKESVGVLYDYQQQYADNQNISFLPAIVSTSTRMHGEFLRLLFLQAHRETEAHFIATGMSSQNIHPEALRFKRAAFYNGLKSKVGLAAAKAAALRINLNVQGCSIVAPPMHAPSRTPLLLPLLLSHNLPTPRVR